MYIYIPTYDLPYFRKQASGSAMIVSASVCSKSCTVVPVTFNFRANGNVSLSVVVRWFHPRVRHVLSVVRNSSPESFSICCACETANVVSESSSGGIQLTWVIKSRQGLGEFGSTPHHRIKVKSAEKCKRLRFFGSVRAFQVISLYIYVIWDKKSISALPRKKACLEIIPINLGESLAGYCV